MKKKSIVLVATLSLCILSSSIMTYAQNNEKDNILISDEEFDAGGGLIIDYEGNVIQWNNLKSEVHQSHPYSMSTPSNSIKLSNSEPIETITPEGYTVTHYGERDFNYDSTKWRAYAWTEIVDKDEKNVYHYTRARVVNAVYPSKIYEDSGRVWDTGKTVATTGYVLANEPLFSMRSYWGY